MTTSQQLPELTKELDINFFKSSFCHDSVYQQTISFRVALWSENVKNDKNLRGKTFYIVTSDLSKEFHTNIFLFKQLFLVFVAFQHLTISQLMITLQHSFCHSLNMMLAEKWRIMISHTQKHIEGLYQPLNLSNSLEPLKIIWKTTAKSLLFVLQ